MPIEDAEAGKKSVIRVLEWMSQAECDKNVSIEVLRYLGQQIARATPEDVEIIMAWMFVGAIADRAMSRVAANEMVKEVAAMIAMAIADDEEAMEA
jgi:hypothetical protein